MLSSKIYYNLVYIFICINFRDNRDKHFFCKSLLLAANLVLKTQFAARPEWSSFCEEERRAKKRERRADKAAIKIIYLTVSPKSVPCVFPCTKTDTMSPNFWPSFISNTQTAFWEFLPFHWFLFFFEIPSIKIS